MSNDNGSNLPALSSQIISERSRLEAAGINVNQLGLVLSPAARGELAKDLMVACVDIREFDGMIVVLDVKSQIVGPKGFAIVVNPERDRVFGEEKPEPRCEPDDSEPVKPKCVFIKSVTASSVYNPNDFGLLHEIRLGVESIPGKVEEISIQFPETVFNKGRAGSVRDIRSAIRYLAGRIDEIQEAGE